MNKLSRLGLATASAVSVIGIAATGIASAGSINWTGPGSFNTIHTSFVNNHKIRNNNNVWLSNHNFQFAKTGNAKVLCNTHGGSALTGDASNWNQTNQKVWLSNNSGGGSWSGWGGGFGGSSISNTGPKSFNSIRTTVSNNSRVTNNNNVSVSNSNNQTARTGNATVSFNTFGGDATTGNAMNSNNTDQSVSVTNNTPSSSWSGLGGGSGSSISNTGPWSNNTVSTTVRNNSSVTNNNNVRLSNSNNQTASTGNATVSGNTFGGSATTGDASNWNSTSQSVAISNN